MKPVSLANSNSFRTNEKVMSPQVQSFFVSGLLNHATSTPAVLTRGKGAVNNDKSNSSEVAYFEEPVSVSHTQQMNLSGSVDHDAACFLSSEKKDNEMISPITEDVITPECTTFKPKQPKKTSSVVSRVLNPTGRASGTQCDDLLLMSSSKVIPVDYVSKQKKGPKVVQQICLFDDTIPCVLVTTKDSESSEESTFDAYCSEPGESLSQESVLSDF